MKLNSSVKILLVGAFIVVSVIGFMVKLPAGFRHIDKELHVAFYFLAAAFLNLLFTNKKIVTHLLIFIILCLFGISIEYAQAYSNKFFHVKIHGRYDPEDVKSNIKDLVAFSICWMVCMVVKYMHNSVKFKEVANKREQE